MYMPQVKYAVFFHILIKPEYSLRIFEKNQMQHLMEVRLVGTDLMHAVGQTDRQADMAKLIVAFRNFVNAPKNSTFSPHSVFSVFTARYVLPTQRIYVFCVDLRKNSDYFTVQH